MIFFRLVFQLLEPNQLDQTWPLYCSIKNTIPPPCQWFCRLDSNPDHFPLYAFSQSKYKRSVARYQGCEARKVILYCSVLFLGANVNTRRMSKPDMGSIIHITNHWNILVIGNYYVNYQNYQNLMILTSSDTKQTLMHLLLFTNSAQTELISICTQSIHNRNWLSLPYILDAN